MFSLAHDFRFPRGLSVTYGHISRAEGRLKISIISSSPTPRSCFPTLWLCVSETVPKHFAAMWWRVNGAVTVIPTGGPTQWEWCRPEPAAPRHSMALQRCCAPSELGSSSSGTGNPDVVLLLRQRRAESRNRELQTRTDTHVLKNTYLSQFHRAESN